MEMHEASTKAVLNSGLLEAVVLGEPRYRQQLAQDRQPGPPGIPFQLTFALLCSWRLPSAPSTVLR